MKWLLLAALLLAGCTAPEPEPEQEVAECIEPCGVPDCTVETTEGAVTSTVTTCVRTIIVEGLVGGVIEPEPDCSRYDAVNDQCYDACPEGWYYDITAASCVQEVCGDDRPCMDPLQNPGGYVIQWTERSEVRCETRPILEPAPALGGDDYYEVCASHVGTGTLLVATDECGPPLAGAPGDNTTAQFCFAFAWEARGGGVHLEGTTSFVGAHSDSHDPENPTALDTPSGDCAWQSDPVQGDYEEVDAPECLGWQPHKAWHYYPGKATGVHEGTTTTEAVMPEGGTLRVEATGQVFWSVTPP